MFEIVLYLLWSTKIKSVFCVLSVDVVYTSCTQDKGLYVMQSFTPCMGQCSREGKGQKSEAPRPGYESGLCCLLLCICGAGGLIPALLGVWEGGGGSREGE